MVDGNDLELRVARLEAEVLILQSALELFFVGVAPAANWMHAKMGELADMPEEGG